MYFTIDGCYSSIQVFLRHLFITFFPYTGRIPKYTCMSLISPLPQSMCKSSSILYPLLPHRCSSTGNPYLSSSTRPCYLNKLIHLGTSHPIPFFLVAYKLRDQHHFCAENVTPKLPIQQYNFFVSIFHLNWKSN